MAAAAAGEKAPKKLTAAGAGKDLVIAAGKGNLETVKLLLKVPGIDVNKTGTDKEKTTAMLRAIKGYHWEIVKELLKVPTIDVNKADADGFTPLQIAARYNLETVKRLLAFPQIDVNKLNSLRRNALHVCFLPEILKLLLARPEIDVNQIDSAGNTPLLIAVRLKDLVLVKLYLAHPKINVNIGPGRDRILVDLAASKEGKGLPVLQALLNVPDFEIPKKLISDAKAGIYAAEVNKAILTAAAKKPKLKWKPKTKSDVERFDEIFDSEIPTNPETGLPIGKPKALDVSTCPVCLKFGTREIGCNYMNHNCTEPGGYFHEELYNKYKTAEGLIYWCTICGRICRGHRHYMLSDPAGPVPDFAPKAFENPFLDDCQNEGGGGIVEKLQRYRRAREVMKTMDPSMDYEDAMNLVIEETWKAPLSMHPKIANIQAMLAAKKFTNYPTNEFPRNVLPIAEPEVVKVYKIPPFNPKLLPVLATLPTEVMNATTLEDITNILHFKHSFVDGKGKSISAHATEIEASIETDRVGIHGFFDILKSNIDKGKIGICWKHPECQAPLHPDEVDEALRLAATAGTNAKTIESYTDLAKRYRSLYSQKFGELVRPAGVAPAGATGGGQAQPAGGAGFRRQSGGERSVVDEIRAKFQEATDAKCTLPNNKTRRRQAKRARQTRKNW